MYDIIQSLITEPLYTVIGILIFWLIFYILLRSLNSLEKWYEYAWVLIGVSGVLFLVAENRKNRSIDELPIFERLVNEELLSLKAYTEFPNHCFKFNNSGVLSQEVFNSRQLMQDSVCSWMKRVKKVVEFSLSNRDTSLSKIPKLNVEDFQKVLEYENVYMRRERINRLNDKRYQLKKNIEDHFWENYKYSFGILFLIIAFALRLATVTKKYVKQKTTPKPIKS
jgi:hypothetical protein